VCLPGAGKNASAEFEEVAREVSSLHTALKELEEEARKPHSLLSKAAPSKQEELAELLKNIKAVLAQLEKLLKKYSSLSSKYRRKWDIIRFGKEGTGEIRTKITFHTSAINLFLTSLSAESLSRIEKKLDEMVLEFRRGDRDASTVANLDEDIPEAEDQWVALKQELVDDGFTRHDIESHKDWIKARLSALLAAEADDVASVRSSIETYSIQQEAVDKDISMAESQPIRALAGDPDMNAANEDIQVNDPGISSSRLAIDTSAPASQTAEQSQQAPVKKIPKWTPEEDALLFNFEVRE
jgi:chromosome segregation ATPase